MGFYKTSKKVRYTLSVVYVVIMGFILIGTYISQPENVVEKETAPL
ncbi:MAG: hypothetical protein Q9M50_05835 [Methylococcales bacterium]|nr:hypothetical protein [Methylococcales bacterium]